MICQCSYDCGAKAHNMKMDEDKQLIQFLMSLHDAFTSVRGNILMMKPLPSTEHAYSNNLAKESHGKFSLTTLLLLNSSGFMTSGQKWTTTKNS